MGQFSNDVFSVRSQNSSHLGFNSYPAQDLTQPWLPYCFVSCWQGLLLLASNVSTSFMAHDEGWYATLALGMVRRGEWLSPRWAGELMYDKTSGVHWLIATAYSLFGVSETTARLPSLIACIACVCLTLAIGSHLISRVAAFLGVLCLSTVILWSQYGQLATQDMPMVAVELFCIWCLLRAENSKNYRPVWGFLAGTCLGIGFFVKGFMVFLAAIALLPYLICDRHGRHHWRNIGLYVGLAFGVSLVSLWFYQLWTLHGTAPFQQLFGMLLLTASEDYHGVGPWYYLWNIPANFLPWTPLALVGLWLAIQSPYLARRWLLLGYPATLLLLLQIFPTKTIYYPLQIYPFLGLYAGLGLYRAAQQWMKRTRIIASMPAYISYGYGFIGLIAGLLILGITVEPFLGFRSLLWLQELRPYALPAMTLAIGWIGAWWLWRSHRYRVDLTHVYGWAASLLLGPWLAIGIAGTSGLLGDYSPEVKAACQQPQVQAVLAEHPVNFVLQHPVLGNDHKIWILTQFCTPWWGNHFTAVDQLGSGEYAWISPQAQPSSPSNYRTITEVNGWRLIQAPP